MFSTLSQGNPIYILDTSSGVKSLTGTIEKVSPPRPKYQTYTPNAVYGMNMETVVDISVRVDGEKREYKNVPSTSSVANFEQDHFVLADSKEAMISQVDMMKQESLNVVNGYERHKKLATEYDNVLKQLNPAFAKEADRDEAIADLKGQMNGLKDDINKILGLLAKKETV